MDVIDHEEVVGHCCDICAKLFSTKYSLNRHLKIHEKNPSADFHCSECGKSFFVKQYLTNHVYKVHKKMVFMCEHCGSNFPSKNSLINHINFKHAIVAKNVCPVCEKSFKDGDALRRHAKSHQTVKSKCDDCGKMVKHLNLHRKSCKTERPRIHACEKCKKSFATKAYLRKHLANKHEVRPKLLCKCGKSYSCRKSMKIHEKKCSFLNIDINVD